MKGDALGVHPCCRCSTSAVETATALALLSGMGCDLAQGYFIARPMPMAGLIDFLAAPAVSEAEVAA